MKFPLYMKRVLIKHENAISYSFVRDGKKIIEEEITKKKKLKMENQAKLDRQKNKHPLFYFLFQKVVVYVPKKIIMRS